ncbi:muconolactone Delta-isomerase [Saccharopolyspora rosea]|uniref:Muconolactone Delta-isomerase n=1 Tax=Saccharopolyspora rosea TaxID=524884 RepID=A0ABW3FVN3_9PSEU|nr:muconolactone Delta-isomerase family protein [Saccharopolyspora rosea]
MLFFLQMRWNHEGRVTLDELLDLQHEETAITREALDSGVCVGMWKVAGQKRVICILDLPSIDELDRVMFGLPMREYLEFEAVWPLRDFPSFAGDVARRYR